MCSDVCVSPDRWVRHPHVCVYTHRQRIGIVEFTKWLLSHSERSAALEEAKQGPGFCRLGPKLVGPPFQVVCVPLGAQHLRERRASTSMARPEYTLAALPLKSIRQLQVQRARRSQAIAKEAASWNAAADVAAPAQRAALSAALRLRAERGLSAAKVKAAKRASSDSTATSDALIDGFSAPRRERWEVPQSCRAGATICTLPDRSVRGVVAPAATRVQQHAVRAAPSVASPQPQDSKGGAGADRLGAGSQRF